MRKWLILLVLALVLGGGAWYFWSLGSLPAVPQKTVVLTIDDDGVEFQKAGTGAWQKAKSGEQIQAEDSVRTNDGAATLTFFDLSQTRLAPHTEVKVVQAKDESSQPFSVNLHLVAGRIWSRILRLFELDDAYSVSTDSVTASVRGTAFDMSGSATGTVITVSESAVQVNAQPTSTDPALSHPLVVSEGFSISFDSKGGLVGTFPVSDDLKQDDWTNGNLQRDAVFGQGAQERMLTRLGNLDVAQPDSLLDGLTQMSEKLHLALASGKAPELYAAYAERRLFAIKQSVERGKSGAAFNALTAFENEITSKLSGPDAERYRGVLRRALFDASTLMGQIGPSSPLYRMKQKVEDLQVMLAGKDELEVAYARMRAIDARLDEALMLINQNSLDESRTALDAARQGLTNVERDIDHLPDSSPRDRLSALRGKLDVLKAREAAYRVRLATAIEPPQSEITESSTSTAAASTDITDLSSPSGTSPLPSDLLMATSSFETIGLSALPGSPFVGDKVQLKVLAIRAGGEKEIVTSRSSFEISGPATLNGSVLTPTAEGTVTVDAVFADGADKFEARMQLQVKPVPVTLQSLKLTTNGPADLAFGATAALAATAVYSNGTSKDVTASTVFTSSNLRLGFVMGNVFTAGSDAIGQANVVGTFTENGKIVTSARVFNIIAN